MDNSRSAPRVQDGNKSSDIPTKIYNWVAHHLRRQRAAATPRQTQAGAVDDNAARRIAEHRRQLEEAAKNP